MKLHNNKGFTLIELMATLAILALIVVIAVPSIGNVIASADDKAEAASIKMIEKAGETADVAGLEHDRTSRYNITTLINKGYLDLDKESDLVDDNAFVAKTNTGYRYFDSLDAGGTNLMSTYNFYEGLSSSMARQSYNALSDGRLRINGVDNSMPAYYNTLAELEPNTDYVMSFNIPMSPRFEFRDADYKFVDLTQYWSDDRTTLHFTTGDIPVELVGKFFPDDGYYQTYPMTLEVQIEKGHKPTHWTPSFIDVEESEWVFGQQMVEAAHAANAAGVEHDRVSQYDVKTLIDSGHLDIDSDDEKIFSKSFVAQSDNDYIFFRDESKGGRNLFLGTDFGGENYRVEHFDKPGESHLRFSSYRKNLSAPLVKDQTYTLKMSVRGDANIKLFRISPEGNRFIEWIRPNMLSETEFRDFSLAFTLADVQETAEGIYISTSYSTDPFSEWFEVAPNSVVLTKGDRAIDWTPAREDVE